MGKNVKIKYSNPKKAQNKSTKRRAVTIHPQVRLVGKLKKTKKRKEGRHPKQWQTGY